MRGQTTVEEGTFKLLFKLHLLMRIIKTNLLDSDDVG